MKRHLILLEKKEKKYPNDFFKLDYLQSTVKVREKKPCQKIIFKLTKLIPIKNIVPITFELRWNLVPGSQLPGSLNSFHQAHLNLIKCKVMLLHILYGWISFQIFIHVAHWNFLEFFPPVSVLTGSCFAIHHCQRDPI